MPELSAYFSVRRPGGRGAELGLPAPIDVQVAGIEHEERLRDGADSWPRKIRKIPGVADVFIPQDIDYPALQLDVDRTRASELGLDQREVVDNVITALTSNQMIAPSYWIDPKTGNDYMLTVQYPENQVQSISDLRAIPLRGAEQIRRRRGWTRSATSRASSRPPKWITTSCGARSTSTCGRSSEDLGKIANSIDGIIAEHEGPDGLTRDAARHGAGHARFVHRASRSACASRWCCCT